VETGAKRPEAEAARDFLHGQPETSAGEFTLPLVTVVLRTGRQL
jgi:hypothetical protein